MLDQVGTCGRAADDDDNELQNDGTQVDTLDRDANADVDTGAVEDETIVKKTSAGASKSISREERLQHDLFVLQKLNAAFSVYNTALKDTNSGTEVRWFLDSCCCSLILI